MLCSSDLSVAIISIAFFLDIPGFAIVPVSGQLSPSNGCIFTNEDFPLK
jgi:hypothetical protein